MDNNKNVYFDPCACKFLDDRIVGDVESVGHHDVGYYLSGRCSLNNSLCKIFVPDELRRLDQSYNYRSCKVYKSCSKSSNND